MAYISLYGFACDVLQDVSCNLLCFNRLHMFHVFSHDPSTEQGQQEQGLRNYMIMQLRNMTVTPIIGC
jgi:hypothetical protein